MRECMAYYPLVRDVGLLWKKWVCVYIGVYLCACIGEHMLRAHIQFKLHIYCSLSEITPNKKVYSTTISLFWWGCAGLLSQANTWNWSEAGGVCQWPFKSTGILVFQFGQEVFTINHRIVFVQNIPCNMQYDWLYLFEQVTFLHISFLLSLSLPHTFILLT